jgi:hypothetical protein
MSDLGKETLSARPNAELNTTSDQSVHSGSIEPIANTRVNEPDPEMEKRAVRAEFEQEEPKVQSTGLVTKMKV